MWVLPVSARDTLLDECCQSDIGLIDLQTENFSIVHGYDGSSFQQHYINQDFGKSFSFSKAHKYRLQCYYTEPGVLNDKFNVSRYWKFHKYRQPNQWLQAWLRREIQALIQVNVVISLLFPCVSFPFPMIFDEEDVDIIVHHILGVLDSVIKRTEQKGQTITPERKQEEFKASVSDAARPFLTGRTDRFVNEVELFLASGLNIEAYDEVYLQQLGWTNPMATTEGVEEQNGHTHVVPYLYLFDYDSDGTD
ncbi:hypothetical protein CK203_007078 [Vitis vinifera]|uniref:Uncharacterized protein n=1 Tax=Vitis vinifera TaxID=29760 RepID=A0A438KCH4_VITVI|nr:hypothetical protein CK203_007078 [Vitis vinifera]